LASGKGRFGLEGMRREMRKKNWRRVKIGQSLGELLAKQKKASERVLWEICPERSILGNGGIRQPRLSRPTLKAELILAGGDRTCTRKNIILYRKGIGKREYKEKEKEENKMFISNQLHIGSVTSNSCSNVPVYCKCNGIVISPAKARTQRSSVY
jgi:hypothetical protein